MNHFYLIVCSNMCEAEHYYNRARAMLLPIVSAEYGHAKGLELHICDSVVKFTSTYEYESHHHYYDTNSWRVMGHALFESKIKEYIHSVSNLKEVK